MGPEIIDVTDEVVAVRRLRGAAALPGFAALCCCILATLAMLLDFNNRALWVSLIGCAPLLVLLRRGIEHGSAWAVGLLTALVSGLTLMVLGSWILSGHHPASELLSGIAGGLLILIPCWLAVRAGLLAIWGGRKTRPWITTASGSAWRWLPRDGRFRIALNAFTVAVLVYVGGAVPAILVAVAFGGHMLIAALVYLPVARLAGRLWNRGRRQLARRLQEIRKLDTRAPVLLLRSFDDDNLPLESRYRLMWFFHAAKEACTLEECVVTSLWQLGPVIAVGNPREKLSPLGAAREDIPGEQWRSRIQQYLEEAAYVVSILGSTPGLNWEYEQVEMRGAKDRVLVVLPPRPVMEVYRRWEVFRSIFRRAASVDIFLGTVPAFPLLVFFPGTGAPLVFRCRYKNETAYTVAFNRLLETLDRPLNQGQAVVQTTNISRHTAY
jgi:hypothetical protein